MSDFKTRLLEERQALGEKLDKLNAFLQGDTLAGLPPAQQDLLKKQVVHMADYYSVLNQRISLLEGDQAVSSTFGNDKDASIGKHDPSLSNSPGPKDQSAGRSHDRGQPRG